MNVSRFIIAVVVVFVFTAAYDFFVHGVLLADTYKSLANLWRPEAEMQALMPLMFVAQLLLATVFTFIFTRNYEGSGVGEGLRYGLYAGLLLGAPQVASYVWMPVPVSLTAIWVGGMVVWGILAGIVVSLVYKEDSLA